MDLELDKNFEHIGFTHFRCLGHIINLAVRNSLKKLKPLIINARKFVSTIKSSGKRHEVFVRCQQRLIDIEDPEFKSSTTLELIEDVDTRWNSCYLMLQRLFKLKKAVQDSMSSMKELEELDPFDWTQIESVLRFLGPLSALSDKLSGEKYCTLSLVHASVPRILERLALPFDDPTIKEAARDLEVKLLSYIEHIYQDVCTVGNILDPRFKLALQSKESIEFGTSLIRAIIHSEPEPNSIENLDNDENDLVFEDLYASDNSDELNSYTSSPRAAKNSDILRDWRAMTSTHPRLASLAR